jgi:small subunit ribosomal protein S5
MVNGMARDNPSASSGENRSYDDQLIRIYRCAVVVKGGRRFSFGALVVMGNRNGEVGWGYGKAKEVPGAVEKATKAASRACKRVPLDGSTIPHEVMGRFGASIVKLVPASAGTGVIAGTSVRAVLELAGVRDVLTKSYGSTSPKNLVKATFDALSRLRSRETVERLRGVSLATPGAA